MSPRPPLHIHAPLPHTFDEILRGVADEQRPQRQTLGAKPFIKWVGGKRSILPILTERLPEMYSGYYEPFIGGGALFFSMQPDKAYLSDINFHLVITYRAVRDDVERLINFLKTHEKNHSKEYFLKARKQISKEKDTTKLASLLIYLNKTCFNGLYRVNKSGEFNVPMGNYKNPNIVDDETLKTDSIVLQGVKIEQKQFSQTPIKKNSFYYLDSPYHNTYAGYDGNGFSDSEHEKLADFCNKIDKAGGYFMLSNSDTDFVRMLYKGYHIEQIQASRSVSCKAYQRGKEYELLIRNYIERKTS